MISYQYYASFKEQTRIRAERETEKYCGASGFRYGTHSVSLINTIPITIGDPALFSIRPKPLLGSS